MPAGMLFYVFYKLLYSLSLSLSHTLIWAFDSAFGRLVEPFNDGGGYSSTHLNKKQTQI
jgi:hypothetical protein